MAYKYIKVSDSIQYIGSSSDTKPTNVMIGTRLYEYNTETTFITYDGNNWVEVSDSVVDVSGDVNIQIGNVDVSNANPVPISDANNSLTVDQSTHDNLNCNSNLQIGDLDVASNNPIPVRINSTTYTDVTFYDAVSATPAISAEFEVLAYKTLVLAITGSGSNSARTVNFYGQSTSGNNVAISGVRISDFAVATNTTGKGEIWQFDVTGLEYVVISLTSITGGTVTIKGRAVV